MDSIWQDLRYALRSLAKSKGLVITVTLALAIAIGANVAVFSVVDIVLFRKLTVYKPEELVRIFTTSSRGGAPDTQVSYPLYLKYRDGASTMSDMAAYSDHIQIQVPSSEGMTESATAAVVTGNYFKVLGIGAAVGRTISEEDDPINGNSAVPLVVLSNKFWRRAFKGNTDILGKELRLNGHSFTIIGVAPADFFGIGLDSIPDMWLPISNAKTIEPVFETQMDFIENPYFSVVGRLKPSASLSRSQAEFDTFAAQLGA